jgi:hypothetical protein
LRIFSGIYEARGATARDMDTGTTRWLDNGLTVTVHSNSDAREEAVAALKSANHGALGTAALTPNDDLSALGESLSKP